MEKTDRTFAVIKEKLQTFQQNRIKNTYADIQSIPEYQKIGDFFFNKLYAPEDFSFRDQSIKTLHKVLKGAVYGGMVSAVGMVIELHELSDRLDNLMVELMLEKGIDPGFGLKEYREIYKALDNYDERLYQIDLSVRVTEAFHRLSKKWVVAVSLKTVRAASFVLGIRKIIDFVHEGYVAFQEIENIEFFLENIRNREIEWHEKLWSEDNNISLPEGNA